MKPFEVTMKGTNKDGNSKPFQVTVSADNDMCAHFVGKQQVRMAEGIGKWKLEVLTVAEVS